MHPILFKHLMVVKIPVVLQWMVTLNIAGTGGIFLYKGTNDADS